MDILGRLALKDKARALPTKMSGGEKQRLVLALALVNEPSILFLDEPTASLDPHARRALWDVVRELNQLGTTIIITTHYMEEAEALSRRVGIIDSGRLLAVASPYELISQFCGTSSITLKRLEAQTDLRQLPGVSEVIQERDNVRIFTDDIASTNSALVNLANRLGFSLQGLHIQQPTLEDVFLSMTGKRLLTGFETTA
jgi:ABC-2 type transport system ATP-binding protein